MLGRLFLQDPAHGLNVSSFSTEYNVSKSREAIRSHCCQLIKNGSGDESHRHFLIDKAAGKLGRVQDGFFIEDHYASAVQQGSVNIKGRNVKRCIIDKREAVGTQQAHGVGTQNHSGHSLMRDHAALGFP